MMDSVAYRKRAERYRPTDLAQLRTEVVRLRATGLTASDIATALRVDFAVVVNWLAEPQP